jgi:hypothetical protein
MPESVGAEVEILDILYRRKDTAALAVRLADIKDVIATCEKIALQARRASIGKSDMNENARRGIQVSPLPSCAAPNAEIFT